VTKKSQRENIIQVKTELADKYLRLARKRRSKPARLTLLRHAERFRQQANNAREGISK
jgi:hypothetical protein